MSALEAPRWNTPPFGPPRNISNSKYCDIGSSTDLLDGAEVNDNTATNRTESRKRHSTRVIIQLISMVLPVALQQSVTVFSSGAPDALSNRPRHRGYRQSVAGDG